MYDVDCWLSLAHILTPQLREDAKEREGGEPRFWLTVISGRSRSNGDTTSLCIYSGDTSDNVSHRSPLFIYTNCYSHCTHYSIHELVC